jgi:hypothetical protein
VFPVYFGRRRLSPPASFSADPEYLRECLDVVDVFVMLIVMMLLSAQFGFR